jgi:hypothetical protein
MSVVPPLATVITTCRAVTECQFRPNREIFGRSALTAYADAENGLLGGARLRKRVGDSTAVALRVAVAKGTRLRNRRLRLRTGKLGSFCDFPPGLCDPMAEEGDPSRVASDVPVMFDDRRGGK